MKNVKWFAEVRIIKFLAPAPENFQTILKIKTKVKDWNNVQSFYLRPHKGNGEPWARNWFIKQFSSHFLFSTRAVHKDFFLDQSIV